MAKVRGWRTWWVAGSVAVAAVLPLYVVGEATRDRAVMRALERRYRAGPEDRPVHIEPGPGVPPGLTAVGPQPVEVVTRDELLTRYAGRKDAPSLTTVGVREQRGLLGVRYEVGVSTTGVLLPGANAIPLGGGRTYYFRQWAGLPWMTGEVVITY
jgi:hypothetical protein